MDSLKMMKDQLISCVQGQMTSLDKVDGKELGEAIDMIKDLSEAIYYCTVTEAMDKPKHEKEYHYYTEKMMPYYEYKRDYDRNYDRMYYGGNGSSGNSSAGSRSYTEMRYPAEMMHDYREGRSGMSRRSYMESKELHQGQEKQMMELEKYIQELGTDITEMIKDATPEEKQLLQQKMTTLAAKIK